MNFEKAEQYRQKHPLGFPHKKGDDFGWFVIPSPVFPEDLDGSLMVMVAPSDAEWQHVSVSSVDGTPTWDEMTFIKDLFWDEEDVVVQFHPKKSEYVNMAENCLHF